MRGSGACDTPTGLAPGDHVCWPYADDTDCTEAVTPYLLVVARCWAILGYERLPNVEIRTPAPA